MEWTHQQKAEFIERGYILVRGAVPGIMVDRALRAINHSVGQGMDPNEMTRMRAQSFCPELQGSPVITDLLNHTPAYSLAEAAIGEGTLSPSRGAQIALRFPTLQDPPGMPRPHLDGMYSPTNGVPEGTIQNFTMLVGVFLSRVPRPNSGNLTVWTGTHRIFEDYFRKEGPESLLEGMPKVEMPEPEPLLVEPGDVALCHYQLAHGVAPNISPHVRYACFFRLSKVGHSDRKMDVMRDIWMEWDGLRDLLDR